MTNNIIRIYDETIHGENKRFLLIERFNEDIRKKKENDIMRIKAKEILTCSSESYVDNFVITNIEQIEDLYDITINLQPKKCPEKIEINLYSGELNDFKEQYTNISDYDIELIPPKGLEDIFNNKNEEE